eukprot:CAMPEP_0116870678 /NCGR_PEP_ID=MMETSP0463-20121206/684_1 /TAXON_ID=181622 /ORGANISM="Strombidinopsis sp, Strain SopsisLIS2011" /LENGTH=120 /DNA_ID=CAMNT_0004507651 /DNA_START=712 /DNA_END=1074 /DNA_ORIENTATION=-
MKNTGATINNLIEAREEIDLKLNDKALNPEEKHLYLAESFYSIAFVSYLKDVVDEYKVTRKMQARNFYSVMLIWAWQTLLTTFVYIMITDNIEDYMIRLDTIWVYATMFITSTMLHMELS